MSAAGRPANEGGYDPAFYARLERVQDTHFWFKARRAAVAAMLRRFRPTMPEHPRVLELGCGNGDVLRVIASAFVDGSVVGLDMHVAGLARARERTDSLLVQGDAAHPPFAVPFDMVAMFDVLEHVQDDLGVLRQVNRLLKPGGLLTITVPADPSLWSYFDEASQHCRRYELADLTEKLATAGFDVEYATSYMCATYPLLRLGRLLRKLFSRRTQSARELSESDLRVWPVLNGVMAFLLGRETRQMEQGRRLRKGSSLLAVARKRPPGTEP